MTKQSFNASSFPVWQLYQQMTLSSAAYQNTSLIDKDSMRINCLFLHIYLLIWEGNAHIWRSENKLQESVLSFYHVGPRIKLIRLKNQKGFLTC